MRIIILFLFLLGSSSSFAQLTEETRNRIYEMNVNAFKETYSIILNEYYNIEFCDCSNLENEELIYFYTFQDHSRVSDNEGFEYLEHKIIVMNIDDYTQHLVIRKDFNTFKYTRNEKKSFYENFQSLNTKALPRQTFDLPFALPMRIHPRFHYLRYCKNGVEVIHYFSESVELVRESDYNIQLYKKTLNDLKNINNIISLFDNL